MAFEDFVKALSLLQEKIGKKKKLVPVAVGEGWAARGMRISVLNGYRVPVWEDEQVLQTDSGDGCTII